MTENSFFDDDDLDDELDEAVQEPHVADKTDEQAPVDASGEGAGVSDTAESSGSDGAAIRIFDTQSPQAREAFTGQADDRIIAPDPAVVVTGRDVPDVPSDYARPRPETPADPPLPWDDQTQIPDAVHDETPQPDPTADPANVPEDLPEDMPLPPDEDDWGSQDDAEDDLQADEPDEQDITPAEEPEWPAESSPRQGRRDKAESKAKSPVAKAAVTIAAVTVIIVALGSGGLFAADKFMNGSGDDDSSGDAANVADSTDLTDTSSGEGTADQSAEDTETSAEDTEESFQRYLESKCSESDEGKTTVTSSDGDHSSPMKAVAGWENAYYDTKDARRALSFLGGSMARQNDAKTMQEGIDSSNVDGYCLSMTAVADKGHVIDAEITEFTKNPDSEYPDENVITQRITTADNDDGDWSVVGIEDRG